MNNKRKMKKKKKELPRRLVKAHLCGSVWAFPQMISS
jgi:hypothetical protein